jgi:hypothetical protein
LKTLGHTVAIAVAACVSFVWGAAATLFFIFRFSQVTDDGPTCFHGTPFFAVAQAIVAAMGILMLIAATWIATSAARPRYRNHLRLSATGALVAGGMWLAMLTLWLPGNPTSPGPC